MLGRGLLPLKGEVPVKSTLNFSKSALVFRLNMIMIGRIMGKITLEKLASMIRDGFAAVDERFAQVDARFETLERKFDAKLDVKISDLRTEMNQRFDQIDEEIKRLHRVDDALSERITTLESGSKPFGLPA